MSQISLFADALVSAPGRARAQRPATHRRSAQLRTRRAACGTCRDCGAEAHYDGPDPSLPTTHGAHVAVRLCVTCHGEALRDA